LKFFDIEETIFGGFSATALAGLPTLVVKFFTKTQEPDERERSRKADTDKPTVAASSSHEGTLKWLPVGIIIEFLVLPLPWSCPSPRSFEDFKVAAGGKKSKPGNRDTEE